jgi:hypothetical protein
MVGLGRASRSGGGPSVAQPELEAAGRFISEQIGLRRPTNDLRDLVPTYDE